MVAVVRVGLSSAMFLRRLCAECKEAFLFADCDT